MCKQEFVLRARGAKYIDLLKSGNGILKTVRDTRACSTDQIVTLSALIAIVGSALILLKEPALIVPWVIEIIFANMVIGADSVMNKRVFVAKNNRPNSTILKTEKISILKNKTLIIRLTISAGTNMRYQILLFLIS